MIIEIEEKFFDSVTGLNQSNTLINRSEGLILCKKTQEQIGSIVCCKDTSLTTNKPIRETNHLNCQTKRKMNNALPYRQPKAANNGIQNVSKLTGPTAINGPNGLSPANVEALVNVSQDLSTLKKSFHCSLCTYTSTDCKRNVVRHIELKHLGSSTVLQCKTCGATSRLKSNLKAHYMSKHGLNSDAAKAMIG